MIHKPPFYYKIGDIIETPSMIYATDLACLLSAVLFPVPFIWYLYLRLFSRASLSSDLPWTGTANSGYLSRAHSTLRSIFNTGELLQDGYYKVCLPFLIIRIVINGPSTPSTINPLSSRTCSLVPKLSFHCHN